MSDPEHALTDRPKAEPSSAPSQTEPAGLTADTVPRFFNWGAFATPVLWSLAMRQWVWAVVAASTPAAVIVGVIIPWGMHQPLSWESIAWELFYFVLIVVSPLWISLIAGIGFMVVADGAILDAEFVRLALPILAYWLIPFAVSLYLGFLGNRLAARGRRFDDDREFRFVQRRWTEWGILPYVTVLLLAALAYLLLRA